MSPFIVKPSKTRAENTGSVVKSVNRLGTNVMALSYRILCKFVQPNKKWMLFFDTLKLLHLLCSWVGLVGHWFSNSLTLHMGDPCISYISKSCLRYFSMTLYGKVICDYAFPVSEKKIFKLKLKQENSHVLFYPSSWWRITMITVFEMTRKTLNGFQIFNCFIFFGGLFGEKNCDG